jgi:hypothetical protein
VGEDWDSPTAAYYDLASMQRGMDLFNAAMLDFCREEGASCFDLAGVTPKTTEIFYDDVHFTEAGARFVAEKVGQRLLDARSSGASR